MEISMGFVMSQFKCNINVTCTFHASDIAFPANCAAFDARDIKCGQFMNEDVRRINILTNTPTELDLS